MFCNQSETLLLFRCFNLSLIMRVCRTAAFCLLGRKSSKLVKQATTRSGVAARNIGSAAMLTPLRIDSSVKEQTIFSILDYPLQAFLQVESSHGRARHDLPFVCLYTVELQSLENGALDNSTLVIAGNERGA